jgi:hypothetical protein
VQTKGREIIISFNKKSNLLLKWITEQINWRKTYFQWGHYLFCKVRNKVNFLYHSIQESSIFIIKVRILR